LSNKQNISLFALRTVWRSQMEWLAIGIENNEVIIDFNK